jgi:hypothetical protein
MASYPSAPAKDDAALRLISARSTTNPRPYPTYTSAGPLYLGVIKLSLNSTGTLKKPTLQPTGAASLYTNDPASTDPIVQISWFQIFKGYIPHERNVLQLLFSGRTATPFGNITRTWRRQPI